METFIGRCIKEMMSYGVSVEFTRRTRQSKKGYNFFYDGSTPKYGSKKLLKINFFTDSLEDNYGVFVHEYAHFLQWKESCSIWKESEDASERFDEWLDGKDVTVTIEDIRLIQKLELDCDRRSLDLIIKNKLPIDTARYIKESNSYILSYNLIFKERDFFMSDNYALDETLQYIPNYHINEKELDHAPSLWINAMYSNKV